jgi:aldose sugar dehydrogenase
VKTNARPEGSVIDDAPRRFSSLALIVLLTLGSACGDGEQSSRGQPEVAAVASMSPLPVDPPAAIPSLAPPEPATAPHGAAVPAPSAYPVPLLGRANANGASFDPPLVPGILRQSVVKSLDDVTDLAVLADGSAFVLERTKGLTLFSPVHGTKRLFAPADLVQAEGGGLLGLAFDPQFERTRRVYVFLTSSLGAGAPANRIVRLTLDADGKTVIQREDLVTGINFARPPRPISMPETAHLGGRLAFGPDGALYASTGDGFMSAAPQSLENKAGKVLRIDLRTATPEPRLIASGVRDPVGVAFDAANEALVVADRGGGLFDELTMVPPGGNAGWNPRCKDNSNRYCGQIGTGGDMVAMNDVELTATLAPPAWISGARGEGLSSLVTLRGPAWGEWNGAFALGFDTGQRIDLIKLDTNGRLVRRATLVERLGHGFSALSLGPDGLYAATKGKPGGEEIVRLVVQ